MMVVLRVGFETVSCPHVQSLIGAISDKSCVVRLITLGREPASSAPA